LHQFEIPQISTKSRAEQALTSDLEIKILTLGLEIKIDLTIYMQLNKQLWTQVSNTSKSEPHN